MTDQNADQGQRGCPPDSITESLTESEMDQKRWGAGLGDSIDGKDVADMGRPGGEPSRVGNPLESPDVPSDLNRRAEAGAVEDLGAGGPEDDEIESQSGTSSGSSGLQNTGMSGSR